MAVSMGAAQRAEILLDRMRETPMRRGALTSKASRLRADISRALVSQGVPGRLAQRVAFQLVFKFHARELYDLPVWQAIGQFLMKEIVQLRLRVGMPDRTIIIALPKLSASQIEEFLEELSHADRRIARTILCAALDAAEPLATGRRYLAEYRLVAQKLRAIDPTLARTLANATFRAGMPLNKALDRIERIAAVLKKDSADGHTRADIDRLLGT